MNYTKLLMTGAAAALLTVPGFAADAKTEAGKAAKAAAAKAAVANAKKVTVSKAQAPAKVAPKAAKADPFSVLPAVVAEMNGKKVTRQEIVNFFKKLSPDGQIPEQLTADMVKASAYELVKAYITKTLVDQAIARSKFKMSNKDIIDAIKAQFNKMPKELYNMMVTQLSQQKITLDQHIAKMADNPAMREQIIFDTFARKAILKNVKVTETDAKKFYDTNKSQFTMPADSPETLRASHILIAIKKGSDGKAELKKANEIYAKVIKNPADFGKLAAENSACPSGKQAQGSLGAFQKGQMVPEFEKATLALKENQISKPVKTQFGWHIIKREALRKAEVRSFASVKTDLIAFLKAQKEQELINNYIASLEKSAKVKILVQQPAAQPMMMTPAK
ncbi:MAG: peptidylprolyl isomerase [Lentisphaeria bacterium]|nr:peptidylprolyl isomerase [Lentisphaeria bacterium]